MIVNFRGTKNKKFLLQGPKIKLNYFTGAKTIFKSSVYNKYGTIYLKTDMLNESNGPVKETLYFHEY